MHHIDYLLIHPLIQRFIKYQVYKNVLGFVAAKRYGRQTDNAEFVKLCNLQELYSLFFFTIG